MPNSLQLYGMWPVRLHEILQARILELVAIPFSRASSPGIEPASLTYPALLSLISELPEKETERQRGFKMLLMFYKLEIILHNKFE